ncbi:methyl-accepting chemotaxis protein [Shewanella surugensis]|uniref:Methyl-accepting chemotaxis protein n=1 Tax=Shewanella surugensis TaxID=212020 RepID=A0ABT0LEN5_9GAMM|nr:methyl-accepting chemotaxis protein [Shewanella surugensis]MCL1126169.1 methyl-accepting chemotaxis protein [Shewanella surugensis]
MKEVKFRWVDQYLIHMTLKTKFAILAILPIFSLMVLTVVFSIQFNAHFQTQLTQQAQHHNQSLSHIIDQAYPLLSKTEQATFIAQINQQKNISVLSNTQVNSALGLTHSPANNRIVSQASSNGLITITDVKQHTLSEMHSDGGYWVVLTLASSCFIIFIVCYYISTFVRGALYTNVTALQKAAEGDLTGRLNYFKVKDEFSHLALSIDTLVDRQQSLVQQMSQATRQIRQVVQSFRNTAQEGQSLAMDQRQHLDSLATAMEQMTAAVKEVARNAEQSSVETQEANLQVEAGSRDINTTVNAIGSLSAEIGEASTAVNHLNDNAAKIDEVVTTINAISEQTNLLALNAAIEAARAGEQGRGFAVVADEVRTLAGRTQAATVEIKAMIEALQSGSHNLTQVMTRTVEKANQGKKHVLETGKDLDAIAHHSAKVYEMSVLIATSAEEQSAVSNEIATNLMDIRNQSHDVEQSANLSVSGCDELHATAEQLDALLVGLTV